MILKSDSRGRVRTPPEQREALLAEFERSGLPATKFSALVGVRYQTFATWVQRHRQQRARASKRASVPQPMRFAEVVVDKVSQPALQVTLPGGALLSLTEPAQVPLAVQLIKALA